jgi:iron complex outermembrane receptor protein
VVETKNGLNSPGVLAEVEGGSFNRIWTNVTYGGSSEGFNWFVGGSIFDEAGWRDYSPTHVNQGFAKLGWSNAQTDINLS